MIAAIAGRMIRGEDEILIRHHMRDKRLLYWWISESGELIPEAS
jgi:hypothetical protein